MRTPIFEEQTDLGPDFEPKIGIIYAKIYYKILLLMDHSSLTCMLDVLPANVTNPNV